MKQSKKLHPIDAFGILKVSLSHIRVEELKDRVNPKVPFPHRHDFFQIMLITKGEGNHQIDFVKHTIRPQQLFFMKPGQMHSWKMSSDSRGILIEFNTQSLNFLKDSTALIHNASFVPDVYVFQDKKQFQDLMDLGTLMRKEFLDGKDLYDLSLQGYLTALLVQIIRISQRQQGPQKSISQIETFKALIEKHFKEQHSVEFYAKALKVSPQALTMQLSRSLGRSPREMIQERILLEAKRYLAFSDLGISEIGFELGFNDANYFTRFFRLHEKKTPAAFRKELLNQK